MDIKISDKLINLAKEIKVPLYIVGGYVRDYFLGFFNDDIDICGSVLPDEMIKVCKKLNYKVNVVNKKLGTLLINPKGDEYYEYTPFRVENYSKGHSPDEVKFVEDIVVDAKRRDFTSNSIYINVLTREIFDPYNGRYDISKKQIKCIETPDKVFSSDGLRILRMVRFASTLGFKVEKNTLKTAKEMTYMLTDISAERKKKELDDLVIVEKKHGLKENNFIKIFNKVNIYKYLFLLPLEKYKIKTNRDYFNFFKLEKEYRFVGFMTLFLLNKYNYEHMPDSQVVFDIQNILGNALRCSNGEIKNTICVFRVLQDLKYKKLNPFIARNYHNLTDFEKKIVNAFVEVKEVSLMILNMYNKGIPLTKKQLKITPEEIGELVGEKYIGKVQEILMEGCLIQKINNNNEELKSFILNTILKK